MTTALDLFAGHGWGVACQWLGITEHGVEIMPEAIATREANGMSTIFYDVWAGLDWPHLVPDHDLLIASPPCQTFSMAGKGAGRQALDEVVKLIDERAYLRVDDLRAFGEKHDPRTALVLTPLAYIVRDLPRYVVLEQVPPVLPVWERYAEEMQRWGYSTWTGVLNAEQYGVPQTRRRAVLIAKRDPDLDGEALPPTPTHSRYYSRTPDKLDVGVEKWVSMAEVLGWAGRREVVWNCGAGGGAAKRGRRSSNGPSAAVTSKIDRNRVINLDPDKPSTTVAADPRLTSREHHYHGEQNSTSTRITIDEAARLQSYPEGFIFSGTKTKQFLQVGNAVPPLLARAILAEVLGL
jgi:DNA (cytosine-5)-methyltransferase 1